jgi:glutamyl-Q tRNA(Asp) synthetase
MAPSEVRSDPIEPRNSTESSDLGSNSGTETYRGRFAPSPTGPLHFGSVIAAVGSFLQARHREGEWLVRMDDLDEPRTAPGAADAILADLERLGLYWDGEICYQHARYDHYRRGLESLRVAGWTFPCGCSRKDYQGIYPGTCRYGLAPGKHARTRRMRVADTRIELDDAVQGDCSQLLNQSVGDFVIHRVGGIFAYHLAVVIDDADFDISEVVRGSDLLGSTPRQIHLQRCLGLPTPDYAHLPVAVNRAGQKLSKQTFAEPVVDKPAVPLLIGALDFLGQQPHSRLRDASLDELWSWAIEHWRMARVPRQRAIHWPDGTAARYVASKSDEIMD